MENNLGPLFKPMYSYILQNFNMVGYLLVAYSKLKEKATCSSLVITQKKRLDF